MTRIGAIGIAVLSLLGLMLTGQIFQSVDADELVVIQSPVGSLTWHITPGIKWQGFGKVTVYKKRSIYPFIIKMRFNDGAHGNMVGSIQYELPTDEQSLTALHVRFGSQEAVQQQLIQTVVDKSVYMTGPLMSSKESYAEKRNALIAYVEDQVANGVYRTLQRDVRAKDPVTGVDKTVTVVEIQLGKDGHPERQEEAVLAGFGVKPFGFSITELGYEEAVEQQIQAQQQATMDVQTAMAEARKAEQRALTVEKEGQAKAATTRWEQEAIKAREVTKAEQEKAVAVTNSEKLLEIARLDALAADQYRISQLRRAEGDAEYKRRVLEADGALAQKLETYADVQARWADAFAKRQVPTTVFGSDGAGAGSDSDVQALLQLLTVQSAKNLSLDMSMPGQKR